MIDLRSWPKKWNDASLRQIANLRSQMKRLARYAHRMGDELSGLGSAEGPKADDVVTIPPSNHRRKAPAEV